jgi:hypothetical protein
LPLFDLVEHVARGTFAPIGSLLLGYFAPDGDLLYAGRAAPGCLSPSWSACGSVCGELTTHYPTR